MFRYLALLWEESNPVARQTARLLRLRHDAHGTAASSWVFAAPGLAVSCTGLQPGSIDVYRLQGDAGAGTVLGRLFERGEPDGHASADTGPSRPLPLTLDAPTSTRLLLQGGRGLVERCWGRYVAFWQDADGASHVLRDPSAGLPCLMLCHGGVTLVFSCLQDLAPLGLPAFEVNWDFLMAQVCQARQHTPGTGLKDVYQILGGERLTRGTRGPAGNGLLERTFLWDPRRIASQAPIEDSAAATALLRAAVRESVQSWAASYRGILLSLSGGLDSSIVLACLKESEFRGALTCFHYFPGSANPGSGPSPEPDVPTDIDERPVAREVARGAGLPLIERARDPHLSLAPLLGLRASHQPSSAYLYHLEHGRLDAQLAREHQADAVFTGWGGDQLFYQDHAIWAAADYAWRHPFSPGLLPRALDCARMDHLSMASVLREALAQHLPRRPFDPRAELLRHRHLLAPEVLGTQGNRLAYLHPLMRQADGIPPGKRWQLQQLLAGPWELHDPLAQPGDPQSVAPLYSQPVLEACLRICADVLVEGGWPRSLARRAFRRDLPHAVISRWHKGGIEDHIYQILRHNIVFVRELLLDGALVKRGILHRGRLEQALSGGASRLQAGRSELLEYLGIEAWLNACRRQREPAGNLAQPDGQGGRGTKEHPALLC